MKTPGTRGQSLTMGFGHSKAGVIRPCAERKTQSPSVNTHNLLKSHTVS